MTSGVDLKFTRILIFVALCCLAQSCSEAGSEPTATPPTAPTAATQQLSPGSVEAYNNSLSNYAQQQRVLDEKAKAVAASIKAQEVAKQIEAQTTPPPTGKNTAPVAPIPSFTGQTVQ
jgi:hypothetical protein